MKNIYLDYNAGAPLHPDAWKAMEPILKDKNAVYNASATHYFGRTGNKIIEKARKQVAALIGANSAQLVFNSGATEGNNTVLQYFARTCPHETILIASDTHPSISELSTVFDNIKQIPIGKNGLICLKNLKELLETIQSENKKISLISCLSANNETGVLQDISKISKLVHTYGALFHCDATQTAGRIPLNMEENGIDFLTLSSHKIGGPQGVGALAIGFCGQMPRLLFGGGQEKSMRAGTQNTAGIAGFGAACNAALNSLSTYQNLATLRDGMEQKIKTIAPDTIIHGENTSRLPNTSFFSHKNLNMQNFLIALDLEGVAVSNGSACSSGTIKPSPTLEAMGLDKKTASNALRVSMGWATKEADVKIFLKTWEKIYTRMAKK